MTDSCKKACLQFGILLHVVSGLPVMPLGQKQIGLWLTTWQPARKPHAFLHGSAHSELTQANDLGQSALSIQGGRHPIMGSPWYLRLQMQVPLLILFLHIALEPHIEPSHDGRGFLFGFAINNNNNNLIRCSPTVVVHLLSSFN